MKCFMTNQDCIFELELQEPPKADRDKMLFVASPFTYPFDEIYEEIIKPVSDEANIEPNRADRAFQLGFVMCKKICKLIRQADYLIADVTEDNPNVYYELGLAWGFGRNILLVRNTDVERSNAFKEIFAEFEDDGFALSYKDLIEIREYLDTKALNGKKSAVDKFVGFLKSRTINVEEKYDMEVKRAQDSYISKKNLCFCCRETLPDVQLYLHEIDRGIDMTSGDSKMPPWKVERMSKTETPLSQSFLERIASSKISLVDVTHYQQRPDVTMYFLLGLSHSLGRQTIPITNRAKFSSDMSPFDIRGLWQISFDKLAALRTELYGILKVIEREYATEVKEYPFRFVWDKILNRSTRLSVLACARQASVDKDRRGGRTNVDNWDYRSVAGLAAFLAEKYKRAKVTIEPPEEKVAPETGLDTDAGKIKVKNNIMQKLQDVNNSVIIVGSPDVSDYAEVILARVYGVEPYHPECKKKGEENPYICWECQKKTNCVGKRGYLFCKNTTTKIHSRLFSSFYRNPPLMEECVLWYGGKYQCWEKTVGQNVEGTTYGVITLLKDHLNILGDSAQGDKWIILLSGFTGVATYGLAQVLAPNLRTPEEPMKGKKTHTLQEILKEKEINLGKTGAQVLVRIPFNCEPFIPERDSRKPCEPTIVDVRAFVAEPVSAANISLAENQTNTKPSD